MFTTQLFSLAEGQGTLEFFTPQQTITCNVQFGVPDRQGECVQMGICRVIIDQASPLEQDRRCRKVTADLYINADGRWEFFFPQANIMPCTERAIFKNKWFPVPVAYQLDNNLVALLDSAMNPVIAMGKYQITKVEGGYIIAF